MDDSTQRDQLQDALDTRNRQFDALLNATNTLQDNFERLADLEKQRRQEIPKLNQRIAELEIANRQLTNMPWGRRSERHNNPDQGRLFDEAVQPEENPDAITADDAAEVVIDERLIKACEERLRRNRERRKQARNAESFPDHIERRERTIDLDDEEKKRLKYIGDSVTERLRSVPRIYVERIVRHKYVVPDDPTPNGIGEHVGE